MQVELTRGQIAIILSVLNAVDIKLADAPSMLVIAQTLQRVLSSPDVDSMPEQPVKMDQEPKLKRGH